MKLRILLFMFIFSCGGSAEKAPLLDSRQERYIQEYKTVFFQMCLSKSAGREVVEDLMSEDVSTWSDLTLGIRRYKAIASLADSIAVEIRRDSLLMNNTICKDCPPETINMYKKHGRVGKRIFDFCLEYYTSSELDEIARSSILK